MEYTVVVDSAGVLQGLWSDTLIDLYGDGIQVERASHVEWLLSGWCIWEVDGMTPMTPQVFPTRETALAWEVTEITRRLIEGV